MTMESLSGLRTEVQELRRQVGHLSALQKIHDLKYLYFDIMDHFRYGEMRRVFTRNARAIMGPYGEINGREALVEFFDKKVFPSYDMLVHCGHNPRIGLTSSTTARGTWLYEAYQITTDEAPRSAWMCGRYEDEYAIEDGEWRIAALSGRYYFNTGAETPFLRERFSPYPPGAPDLPDEYRILPVRPPTP